MLFCLPVLVGQNDGDQEEHQANGQQDPLTRCSCRSVQIHSQEVHFIIPFIIIIIIITWMKPKQEKLDQCLCKGPQCEI